MKKIKLSVLVILAVTTLSAEVKQYSTEHIEQFEYNRGLKHGMEKGYKTGYKDALEFAKRQLRLYGKTIQALEAGKYLKEYDKKITNPAIYQENQGGSVRVIVRGCRIAKPLTPDDIIELPIFPVDASGSSQFKFFNMDATSNSNIFDSGTYTNSSDVVARDGNGFYSSRPLDPYTNNASFMYLGNTQSNRKQLELLNRAYTIEDNKIKITFKYKQDRENFIERISR
jgi:hypothetical protein